jgi:hypothetical protein
MNKIPPSKKLSSVIYDLSIIKLLMGLLTKKTSKFFLTRFGPSIFLLVNIASIFLCEFDISPIKRLYVIPSVIK